MQDKTKILLKKMFPMGLLMWAHHTVSWFRRLAAYPVFWNDWKLFQKMSTERHDTRFALSSKDIFPILHEKTPSTGFDRHYIYHPAWAARKIAETKPAVHLDISSTLHFCTLVSAFVPVEFYDYRPAELTLSGLQLGKADLTALHFADNSIQSLSCMHTVEHIGLGRYGDPIDPTGDIRAMKELARVLAKGGNLFFVVPTGKPVVQFNAQRVYSYDDILHAFSGLRLKQFALIPDAGSIVEPASKELADAQAYGCGCYWFTKD